MPSASVLARTAAAAALLSVTFGSAGCADDAPEGTQASISASSGGASGGGGRDIAGTSGGGGTSAAAGQAGASTAGAGGAVSGGNGGGAGSIASGGTAGTAGTAGAGASGGGGKSSAGGAGNAGSGAGGNPPGDELPPGGPLYHVTCLTSIAGGDPSHAFRFAAKILAPAGGQRLVYLRALPFTASTMSEATGVLYLGKTAGPAVEGDVVVFDQVTIPPQANPISGSLAVLSPALLRLVIDGPENRPCAELDGSLTKPVAYDLSSSGSVDTCLFDPVASDSIVVEPVMDLSRFVVCKP